MPQGPIAVSDTNLIPQGAKSVKGVTSATIVKTTPGTILGYSVIVAGSGAGTINDMTTGGTAAAANQVGATPTTAGNVLTNPIPCNTGISVTPGTGQTIAIWYI